MKKTLLATAIAGALGVSAAAQAATVYDQDGTKMDIYGRIAMGIAGGGPEFDSNGNEINNDPEFVDAFSRLGVRLSHEVTSDLTAFGHLEWRFRADGNDNRFDAFHETRQSYLGLRSDTFGTFQAGNFDSFYLQAVSSPFDVYIDRGLEFVAHPKQSRGDSIGYISPNLEGFQVFIQAKHYSDRGNSPDLGEPDRGTTVATQGGVSYEVDRLRLAAGWVEDVVRGGGNSENIYGATAVYEFIPGFAGRLGYETRDSNEEHGTNGPKGDGYDTWGIGMTYAWNEWAFNLDYYNVDEDRESDRDAWAAGAYYNISSNFDVFLEVADSDAGFTSSAGDNIRDLGDDVYWLTGARYFF